jgi:hypothetical protein
MTPGEQQSARDAAAGRGQQMAIARMNDDRARQQLAFGRWVNDLERGIQVNQDTGETRPITSGGAPIGPRASDKAPTEGQSNAFLFASRAAAANDIINTVTATDAPRRASVAGAAANRGLTGVPLIGESLAAGQNFMLSEPTQQLMQAQRDFINAVLRKESGAVIGKDEFDSAALQYFPQPGDSPRVIEQKAASRRRAIEGISAGAGSLAPRLQAPSAAPSGDTPRVLRFDSQGNLLR